MVIVSPEGRYLAANETFCDYLGYTEKELLGKTVQSLTFAEDWPSFSQKLKEALTEEGSFQSFEKRCLHKSGRIVCTESSASVIRSRDGNPQYIVGGVLDITKRKEAEEALSTINRRLTEAQEQERTRIARDLHDDINQRLGMLAIQVEELRRNPPDSVTELSHQLAEIGEGINEVSMGVQSISHQLHSPQLEYLGVVAAMKSFCREFGARQKVEIDFKSDEISQLVSHEVSLCLFRILQEGLHNAAKHSGVHHFRVRLNSSSNELHLTVSDRGAGFDAESTMNKGGLGLISMRERVRLVSGTIVVESKPMGGTTIHVRVPFESAQRLAG